MVNILVPSRSDKKAYEEPSELYEKKKSANVFGFKYNINENSGYTHVVRMQHAVSGSIDSDIPNGNKFAIDHHVCAASDEDAVAQAKRLHMHPNAELVHVKKLNEEALDEGKRLVHTTPPNAKGQYAKIYKDSETYGHGATYHNADGSKMEGGTPYHTEDEDKESVISTANADLKYMGDDHKIQRESVSESTKAAATIAGHGPGHESYSLPHGMSPALARMFGYTNEPVVVHHDNDKTKPETQQHAMVASPEDLAVTTHLLIPGNQRKAVSLEYVKSALHSGLKPQQIVALAHSRIGRQHLRSYAEGVEQNPIDAIVEAFGWFVEVSGGSADEVYSYKITDGDDIIAEGVNLTKSGIEASAVRRIESLTNDLVEGLISQPKIEESKEDNTVRVLDIIKSMTK